MYVAIARETETVPRIIKVRDSINIPRFCSRLYRSGFVFVARVEIETEIETERTDTP